jgi:ATP-dependent Clp protease protease subunit
MYINSPGGSVSSGLSIYDTMQYIAAPVNTIILGQAASMGSLLACAGTKRYALPHATIMMHQPSGGYSGTTADIQIHAKEILRIRDQLNGIYRRHLTKKMTLEDIERLMDRDYFMSAQEAKELGLVDEVLESRKKIEQKEDEKK